MRGFVYNVPFQRRFGVSFFSVVSSLRLRAIRDLSNGVASAKFASLFFLVSVLRCERGGLRGCEMWMASAVLTSKVVAVLDFWLCCESGVCKLVLAINSMRQVQRSLSLSEALR